MKTKVILSNGVSIIRKRLNWGIPRTGKSSAETQRREAGTSAGTHTLEKVTGHISRPIVTGRKIERKDREVQPSRTRCCQKNCNVADHAKSPPCIGKSGLRESRQSEKPTVKLDPQEKTEAETA